MALQIFLNATLRQYLPGYDPYEGIALEVKPGTTVAQVLATLGVPAAEVALLMVDGRRREEDFVLPAASASASFPHRRWLRPA